MKNKLLIFLILSTFIIACAAAVSADGPYTFELSEADRVENHDQNWYMVLSVPQVSGLADKEKEKNLNDYFLSWRDHITAEYKYDTGDILENFSEGELPHFGYEYNWEKVADTDDYFVFRTYLFYAAGSSMTVNEYWTLDKHSGELLDILDAADKVRLEEARSMILEAMKQENEKQEIFWVDENDFKSAFSFIEENHHWYINENGNLVITFDKYEIAPGAFGESKFEILEDKAVLLKDTKYSFNLYVGDVAEVSKNNWYLNIRVPVVGGLSDEDQESQLNKHFADTAKKIQKEYETAVATAEESASEDGPHFGYEYFYEILTDSNDYFSFKTVSFFAAGSSMTSNEFWTLDKNTGKLVSWDEVVTPDMMQPIHDQILAEMTAANESGKGMYYTDEETLGFALKNVPVYRHWYLNNNGDLVITFDKYEVAVGAQGTPEFVINR
jgi:hypothetical protein